MNDQIENYVSLFGEQHRQLIKDALLFLEDNESKWTLSEPINKLNYLKYVMGEKVPKQK